MKMKRLIIGAGLVVAAALPVYAHHSFAAEFDANKPVSLKGAVTKLEWGNPHIWVYLDVKDDQGTLHHWQCEGGAPNTLTRNGWSKDSLKFGDQITIDGVQAKDGSKTCNARVVKFPDGRRVFAGSSGATLHRRPSNRRSPPMKKHFAASLLTALAAAIVFPVLAAGQQEYQPPAGPAPRTSSGKVDFSGVWQKPYVPDLTKDGKDFKGFAQLPFTPWGETEWKKYDAAEGDYTGACLPFGMTRSVNTPEPMQIMQSDTYFTFLFEQNSWFAVVPIDGRQHRKGIADLVRRLGRSLGRRHAGHRHRQLQRQDPAGYDRPSPQRSAAPDPALLASRPRSHFPRNDRRRPQGVHDALEDHPDLHAADRLGDDGVLLRGK